MGYSVIIGGDDQHPLASLTGWADAKAWINTIDAGEFESLVHLAEYGWTENLATLREQIAAALKASPPDDPTVADTMRGLIETLKKPKGDSIFVSDGTTSEDGPDDGWEVGDFWTAPDEQISLANTHHSKKSPRRHAVARPGQRVTGHAGKGGGVGSNQYQTRGTSRAGVKRSVASINGVQSAGSPSPAFHSATAKAVRDIPKHITAVLRSKGVRTIAAKDASDVLSAHYDMNGKPRGYWSGALNEVGGAYVPHTKQAFVTEHEGPTTARTKTSNPAGVMRHEIGHAVDDNFLDHRISQREDFKSAYRADLLKIMHVSGSKFEADGYSLTGEAGQMSYFIQPELNAVSGRFHASDAGYSEAFAEGFASLHGGGAMSPREFSISFPNTVKKIKELTAEKKTRKGKR